MKELFKIIPEDFFVLLTLNDKKIYVKCLILAWDLYKKFHGHLTRDELISRISDEYAYELIEIEDSENGAEKYSNPAYGILRKLIKYGWLQVEDIPEKLETYIRIPFFSSKIIEVIKNIISPDMSSSINFAANVQLNLINIGNESVGEYLIYLENANRDTINLVNFLHETFDSMRNYYSSLLKHISIGDILREHFEDYSEIVTAERFHKIITKDNIFKYRQKILSEINRIEGSSEEIKTLVNLYKDKHIEAKISDLQGESEVYDILNRIKITFEDIDDLMNRLRRMHSKYVKTTTERVNYLIRKENNINDSLRRIVNILAKDNEWDINEYLSKYINLSDRSSLYEKSIYRQNINKPKFSPTSKKLKAISLEEELSLKNEVINKSYIKNKEMHKFSEKNILLFIEELIGKNFEFNIIDLKEMDKDLFIKIILAYDLTHKNNRFENMLIDNNFILDNFNLPEIIFRRKN